MNAVELEKEINNAIAQNDLNRMKGLIQNDLKQIRLDIALWQACECGRLRIVKLLVENGANISASGSLALSKAIANQHIRVVQCLINKCKDCINGESVDSAIKGAFEDNYIDVIKYMVEVGYKLRSSALPDSHKNWIRNSRKTQNLFDKILGTDIMLISELRPYLGKKLIAKYKFATESHAYNL